MAILWILYFLKGYAPFGDNSLATMDADIQYLDFFAYYKDVLAGENSIAYTFSKSLGGTNVASYAYYLASPFSLLVVFFDKANLVVFFNLVVSLKLALASITCTIFLQCRFRNLRTGSMFHRMMILLLAISYALSQYSIAQSSNIMWLDGVYMLPLVLLGVCLLIREQNLIVLAVSVGCAILFNWYSGAIDCLFSVLWFVFELVFFNLSARTDAAAGQRNTGGRAFTRRLLRPLVQYILAMIIGVMLSCILFLPTYCNLSSSSRGSLDFSLLTDISMIGNLLTVIENYVPGAMSAYGSVSIFCGSIALLGCIGCIFRRWDRLWKRLWCILLAAAAVLLLYWQPLYGLFSLLKDVYSYWCRYSYLCIFALIVLAAWFYMTEKLAVIGRLVLKSGAVFAVLLLVIHFAENSQSLQKTVLAVVFLLLAAVCLAVFSRFPCSEKKGCPGVKVSAIALCAVFAAETGCSVSLQMDNYHASNTSDYAVYTENAEELVSALKEYDTTAYRISQTYTRKWGENNLTANYNEALAYNYRSIAGYSSVLDDYTGNLLDGLGYRRNSASMNTVNTSILAADSLLGVKYILSSYEINGLVCVDSIGANGYGISVYENPYCLSLALTYDPAAYTESGEGNAFEFQNACYSTLLGSGTELYTALEYTRSETEDGRVTYTITIPDGNYAVYGNIPWNTQFEAVLDVNGMYETDYACWGSPSVFYIPTEKGDSSCTVTVSSENTVDEAEGAEQFYALDLDLLEEVTARLEENAADSIVIENGSVTITVDAEAGESLYAAIPYDDEWTVTVNGSIVEAQLFAGSMYSIPLTEGENNIEMVFSVKYGKTGRCVTIAGIIALAVISAWLCVRKKRRAVRRSKVSGQENRLTGTDGVGTNEEGGGC